MVASETPSAKMNFAKIPFIDISTAPISTSASGLTPSGSGPRDRGNAVQAATVGGNRLARLTAAGSVIASGFSSHLVVSMIPESEMPVA